MGQQSKLLFHLKPFERNLWVSFLLSLSKPFRLSASSYCFARKWFHMEPYEKRFFGGPKCPFVAEMVLLGWKWFWIEPISVGLGLRNFQRAWRFGFGQINIITATKQQDTQYGHAECPWERKKPIKTSVHWNLTSYTPPSWCQQTMT